MLAEAINGMESWEAIRPQRSCVRIGKVALVLNGISTDEIRLSRELEEFRTEDGDPDIEVSVNWSDSLRAWQDEPEFCSGALWTLFRDGAEFIFDFVSPALGANPYKRLRVDPGFSRANMTLNRELLGNYGPIFPLEYPADELLITNYLASGLGVEVHGCGLIDRETGGHLFLGHSGAGKSTITLLWKALRNPEILSDDRIILRLHDGELWMYGTPWHGEAAFASPGKARIHRIFILEHGEVNEIVALPSSRAIGELFARSFPPFHSAAGLGRTVEFLSQVLDAVPCYQLQFIPHRSAVEAVIHFNE
jgi:hypothetical protein